MNKDRASYRQIVRSGSLIGGAALGSMVISSVRVKVFALMVGPIGIGIVGLLTSVLATAALLSQMGTATSGVRQLTASVGDPQRERELRVSLWSLTLLLALVGSALLWLLRMPIARLVGEPGEAGSFEVSSAIAWLALALVFTAIAGAQTAIMQAHRRIGDLARVQLFGALLGAVGGISVIAAFGLPGVAPAVMMVPLGLLIVATIYLRRVPPLGSVRVPRDRLLSDWRGLISLGFALMAAQVIGSATQILVRTMIVRDMGLEAAGLFQAAWGISVTNMGLVLTAMIADYLPRLSATGDDSEAQTRLVNQQLWVGLLVSAPLLAGLIAAAPIVLNILYSSQFEAASGLLRWQLAGDVFKLGGWAVGYVLIVRNDKLIFVLVDASFAILYVPAFLLLKDAVGLDAAGIGYAIAYASYFVLVSIICARRHGVSIEGRNVRAMILLTIVNLALLGIAYASETAGLVVGVIVAAILALIAVRTLGDLLTDQPIGRAAMNLMGRLRRRPK